MVQDPFVVGIDGSPASDAALAWALEVAPLHDAAVQAVHAWDWGVPPLGVVTPDVSRQVAEAAERTVHAVLERGLAARPDGAGTVQATARTAEGDTAVVLTAAAARASALVLGRHGQSALRRRLHVPTLGSVTSFCLSRSPVPVVVVPAELDGPPERVVVGVDGSDASTRAVAWAADHARRRGVPVVAVLAWQLTTLPAPAEATADWSVPPLSAWERVAERLLDRTLVQALGTDSVAAVERVLLHSPAAAALLSTAGPRDLLVLGDRGRGGFGRLLLGSVSRQCAEHATGAVVVVPSEDRRS